MVPKQGSQSSGEVPERFRRKIPQCGSGVRFRSRPEKFQGKVPEQGFGEVASEVPERFRNKVPELLPEANRSDLEQDPKLVPKKFRILQ